MLSALRKMAYAKQYPNTRTDGILWTSDLWPADVAPIDAINWISAGLERFDKKWGERYKTHCERWIKRDLRGAEIEGADFRPFVKKAGPGNLDNFSTEPYLFEKTISANGRRSEHSLYDRSYSSKDREPVLFVQGIQLAWLFTAARDVEENLRRPAISIDAGKHHNSLLTNWRDLPKPPVKDPSYKPRHYKGLDDNTRIELIAPDDSGKGPMQLSLLYDDGQTLHEATIQALHNWRGYGGLRNWAAFQNLLTTEGGRQGRVTWFLDNHLRALGYKERQRRDTQVRERTANEVVLYTKMELAVYSGDMLRERRPLILVESKLEHLEKKQWRLEGMELNINPLLYGGVRNMETKRLGKNSYPVPLALPQIDHVRYPHAIVMGLLLPIRWRWDWAKNQDHTRFTGRKLLRFANIEYNPRRSSAVWKRLQRNLDVLKKIDLLGRIEWTGQPWTLDGVACLYPAQWLADRTVYGLTPKELPPVAIPKTGSELRQWRLSKGFTQTEIAKLLNVSARTIQRAERSADKQLPPAIPNAIINTPPENIARGLVHKE